MKKRANPWCASLLAITLCTTAQGASAKILNCSNKTVGIVKTALRDFSVCARDGGPAVCANFNRQVYDNAGGHGSMRLPPAPKGQYYLEGRAGHGAADSRRFVFLMEGDAPDAIILKRYFSLHHYEDFCEIDR